jgi:hypothetical protein
LKGLSLSSAVPVIPLEMALAIDVCRAWLFLPDWLVLVVNTRPLFLAE